MATKSAAGVNLLKTALIGIGGALVLAQTVRTIANFEQAMSTVQAVSQATDDQLKNLTATARELGTVTRFTASQAAEGLVELARSGFTVNEQLQSVGETLLLAQAGALDLSRAAEIAVGTLRGFRLAADQAGRVVDVLAYAANDAATDVNQLGDAMRFVAPVAAGMNVPLEETVAVLMALADAQLKGMMGGTGLRQTLAELESPSTKTRKTLKSLGVEVEEVRITSVGLTNALIRLKEAGITTGLALQIFGRRGGPAFEVMSNAIPKIQAARKALESAGGTARRVADIMDDNLNGALLRTKSAYESVQLSFGQMGGSTLLVSMLETLTTALRFLSKNIAIVDGAIIALAAIALPKLIAGLLMLAPALSIFALGATIGAIVVYRNEIEMSKDSIVSLGDFAAATWERMREGAAIMAQALQALPGLGNQIKEMFGDLDISLEGFIKGSARLLDRYIGLWIGVVNVIKAIWSGLGPALKDITISLLNGVIEVVESGLKKILGGIDAIVDKIPGMGKLFGDVATLEIIPRIVNTAEGALIGMDEAIAKGFAKGTATSVFEDSVNELFDRAEEIAKERLAKQTIAESQRAGPQAVPTTAGGAPTPGGQSRVFEVSLQLLDEQIGLLRLSNEQREIAVALRKQEISLSEKGIEINEAQRAQLVMELERLQLLSQVTAALDEVRGAEINLAAAQQELNRQVANGNITLAQARQAYRLLQDEVNATKLSVGAGFQSGLNEIGRTINDFASQTKATLVNAFNSAEDALVNFVKTGKMDFKSLVDSILGDLTRLLTRMMLSKAIGALGGGSGALASLFSSASAGAGKAGGGDVQSGTMYPVGEDGPELFTPSVPGQIIPNDKIKKAVGRPEGEERGGDQIVIINVSTKEEALAAMGSSEGKRIFVNYMGEAQREVV